MSAEDLEGLTNNSQEEAESQAASRNALQREPSKEGKTKGRGSPSAKRKSRVYSYKAIVQRLQHNVRELQLQQREAAQNNLWLKEREMLLYQSVQEQSDFLHNIASVLFGGLQHAPVTSSNDDAAAVAETVWKDWEVFQSLQLIGSTMSSTSSSQESYTIRRLKAAITPEEVAWAQSASLHEVATRLKHLAMRISFQMSQADNPNVLRLMADSLEDSVDRVVELHMLLFAVSPEILPQLSELNVDTCEAQTAPEGLWESIIQRVDLRPDQIQQITSGFTLYMQQRLALEADLWPVKQEVMQLLRSNNNSSSPAPRDAAAGVHARGQLLAALSGRPSSSSSPLRSRSGFKGLQLPGLDLVSAERLEHCLVTWQRSLRMRMLLIRSLIMLFINTLDKLQLAKFGVYAYPFTMQPVPISECIARTLGGWQGGSGEHLAAAAAAAAGGGGFAGGSL